MTHLELYTRLHVLRNTLSISDDKKLSEVMSLIYEVDVKKEDIENIINKNKPSTLEFKRQLLLLGYSVDFVVDYCERYFNSNSTVINRVYVNSELEKLGIENVAE